MPNGETSTYDLDHPTTLNIKKGNTILNSDYSIRIGDYASVKILNPTGSKEQIALTIKMLQERFFLGV